MTDRPIIFSAPMVRAMLEGRKTQTRRVLKHGHHGGWHIYHEGKHVGWSNGGGGMTPDQSQSFYAPGDRLYVREAFSYETLDVERNGFMPPWYWADGSPDTGNFTRPKPSIHMPRWASRLTLTVTDVRVQRLQEISDEDAWAEGCKQGDPWDSGDGYFPAEEPSPDGKGIIGWDCARDWYADLWDHLHGPDAWDGNPWVAALTFTVQHGNIDANPTQIQGPQP